MNSSLLIMKINVYSLVNLTCSRPPNNEHIDIAVLSVRDPFVFGVNVQPICIADRFPIRFWLRRYASISFECIYLYMKYLMLYFYYAQLTPHRGCDLLHDLSSPVRTNWITSLSFYATYGGWRVREFVNGWPFCERSRHLCLWPKNQAAWCVMNPLQQAVMGFHWMIYE